MAEKYVIIFVQEGYCWHECSDNVVTQAARQVLPILSVYAEFFIVFAVELVSKIC